jgi:hypothetical protein
MPEQQADYDTDDTQPTPGPLRTKGLEVVRDDPLRPDEYWVIASFSVAAPQSPHAEGHEPEDLGKGPETAKKNAKLYAAAGTAASELPDGWDAVDVLEALPKLLHAADMAVDSALFRDEDGHAHPPDRNHMLDLRSALNAARGDSDE